MVGKQTRRTSFLCCKQPVNYVSSLQKYDRRILFYELGAIENKVNTHIYSTVQYEESCNLFVGIDVCIVSVFFSVFYGLISMFSALPSMYRYVPQRESFTTRKHRSSSTNFRS